MDNRLGSVIGIDYSFTSPSICILGDDFASSKFYFMNSVKKVCVKALNYDGTRLVKDDFIHDVQRYDHVSDWAIEKIMKYYRKGETRIFLEGFSFGSTTGKIFNVAENGGTLKYKLYKHLGEIPTLFAPTSVKKFYTGQGNCGKDSMVFKLYQSENKDVMKELGMSGQVKSPVHDIVDSYAIALLGRHTINTTKP